MTTPSIICARRSRQPRRCYACSANAKFVCDHPFDVPRLPDGMTVEDLAELNEETRLLLTTCSRPCCGAHAAWWRERKHLCREHAEKEGVWA